MLSFAITYIATGIGTGRNRRRLKWVLASLGKSAGDR